MKLTRVFAAVFVCLLAVCTTATAQVTMKAELVHPDGWMKGGWGTVKFTFTNDGNVPARIVGWTALWEVNGEPFSEADADEDTADLPAGKATVVSKIGWLNPDAVDKAKPGDPVWTGTYTIEAGDEQLEVPFRIEVPEAVISEPMVLVEGTHVSFDITDAHNKALGDNSERLLRWLNQAYEAMADLTGYAPYGGAVIVIKESPPHPWYAYAGNPIIMDTTYMDDLVAIVNRNEMPFGWIHEMGHDFDDIYGDWYIWGGTTCEGQANIKLVYAYEAIADQDWKAPWPEDERAVYPAPVKDMPLDGRQCMDSQFLFEVDKYLSNPSISWEDGFCEHAFLQRLARVYGWDPVKKWYRTYKVFEDRGIAKPETPTEKIRLMAAILCETTGADLVTVFQLWRAPVTHKDIEAMKAKYPIEEAVGSIVLPEKETPKME